MTVSQRKNPKLFLIGHGYNFYRGNDTGITWTCATGSCKGRVKTSNNILHVINNHLPQFCVANPVKVKVHKAKLELKQKAENFTGLTPVQVTNEIFGSLSDEVVAQMPLVRSSQRAIRNIRNGKNQSANYNCIADIDDLPDEVLDFDGENILCAIVGSGNQRSFIFSRSDLLDIFAKAHDIHADGTFDVAPLLFAQLYTIFANFHGTITPVVYMLLHDKSQTTYSMCIQKVIELLPHPPRFSRLTVDFEIGAINAFISQSNNLAIQGCFFHFSQVILRNARLFIKLFIFVFRGANYIPGCYLQSYPQLIYTLDMSEK